MPDPPYKRLRVSNGGIGYGCDAGGTHTPACKKEEAHGCVDIAGNVVRQGETGEYLPRNDRVYGLCNILRSGKITDLYFYVFYLIVCAPNTHP
ncbi:hypothetical protein JCM25156A_06930 [Komagataeibacter kakiaceti JCM 25156]